MTVRIVTGDCRDVLPTLDAQSFDCIVTSPPYWGLRDYGVAGLNPAYREMGADRISGDAPLFAEVTE